MMANDRQSSLKIISLNVCGLRGKTRQLGQLIAKYAPDIVCLQETNVSDKFTQTKIESELKVKSSIFNKSSRQHNGTAILNFSQHWDLKNGNSHES